MGINKKILLWAILLALVFAIGAKSETDPVKTDILRIKLDRAYFDAGVEENLFPGCAFNILSDGDTLYSGFIEVSFPGISYSYPDSNLSNPTEIDSVYALIYPADIDSLTPINVGILRTIPYGDASNFPGLISAVSESDSAAFVQTKYGNILHTYWYDSDVEMKLDFESGQLDAYISYSQPIIDSRAFEIVSTPAPFYAALIPNISKPVNIGGMMTTSMYYRFNHQRLTAVFDGDNLLPLHSLYPRPEMRGRMYEYDPAKGRGLLEYIDKKPKKLQLAYQNESLKLLADYFADILSRDRIKVLPSDSLPNADVYLEYIPISKNKIDTSLYAILHIIKKDLPENSDFRDGIEEVVLYLARESRTDELSSRIYYLDLAQRILMEDIGIFPLFRPSIYFMAGKNLAGYSFDADGLLRIENLRKIIKPNELTGDIR